MNPTRLSALAAISLALPSPMSAADYAPALPAFEEIVRQEMAEWEIGGVAVALVDGDDIVYTKGFGEATEDSLFRVGSISKLFNALAVMQQVEAGALDLDAPMDPALLPSNPFPDLPAVTLRQILCHRSGLQRESTVGGYLDNSEPGLHATVESLRLGVLATRPGEKTRYSNIAPSLAGFLVEKVAGTDFVAYQKEHLLGPLGMEHSAWRLADLPDGKPMVSHMRVADAGGGFTRRKAPDFDLGTIPAGNLFSTAGDIARFASALLAGGKGIVKPETLAEMWKPQLTADETGFGLGFVVGKFRDHRMISHGGAVYGFSTSVVVLPEAGLAAVVLANEDIANARVSRIRTEALSLMLAAKHGEKTPEPTPEYRPDNLAPYLGTYESESYWAEVTEVDGRLAANISSQPTRLTPTAKHKFLADSKVDFAAPLEFQIDPANGRASGFTLGATTYRRVSDSPPLPNPGWKMLLGSYGPDFIPLVVSERHGHLYVMTENMVDYRLTPVNQNTFELCPGMYVNEHLVFLTDGGDTCPRINFCNMFFNRNP